MPGARDTNFICKFEQIRNLIFFVVRGEIHASLHVLHATRVRDRGAMLLCLQKELRLGHGFYLRRVFLQCHRRSNFSTGTSLDCFWVWARSWGLCSLRRRSDFSWCLSLGLVVQNKDVFVSRGRFNRKRAGSVGNCICMLLALLSWVSRGWSLESYSILNVLQNQSLLFNGWVSWVATLSIFNRLNRLVENKRAVPRILFTVNFRLSNSCWRASFFLFDLLCVLLPTCALCWWLVGCKTCCKVI